MPIINIGNKKIGQGQDVFIVAELGVNHNGNITTAKKMIETAKSCGVDGVKLQSFVAEKVVCDKTLKYTYLSQGKQKTETQFQMFKRLELSQKVQKELFSFAKKLGLIIFSTPQDNETVDFLISLNMPVIKIGSDDLTNLPLIEYCAKKQKPILIATGMAGINEVADAVKAVKKTGNNKIILLKCASLYPTPAKEANLLQIKTLQKKFNVTVGYSDHTQGITAVVAAVALGAHIIEKHFTLSHKLAGPDHWFSADPTELKALVKQVREAQEMLGKPSFVLSKEELKMKRNCRRSIAVSRDIKQGETFSLANLMLGKPGTGLAPKYLSKMIGKKAKKSYTKGELIKL